MSPRATYRLQLTADFGFADAAALAPYLAALGVSHVYLSPIFAARPGSTHGYDVTDPGRLNAELGTGAEFRAMSDAFRAAGLGAVADFVPNHMGVGGASNPYWLSVLEWGAASPYAGWFDIDWNAPYPGLVGKLLVPFLGDQYGQALTQGDLELSFDPAEGGFAIWAHGTHKLPVCPRDYAGILRHGPGLGAQAAAFEAAADAAPDDPCWGALKAELARAGQDREAAQGLAKAERAYRGTPGDPASWSALDALIERQHWRAAKFTLAGDAINYRRFFTISDLAGVRVERPEVFDATHGLLLRLLEEGRIDGIRIDHIDGLLDPKAYALRLRERAARPFYLVVEKILAPDEALPADWGTDGTTGYEFANLVVGLLVDPAGTEPLSDAYAEFTGRTEPPGEIVHAAKREVMAGPMAAEREALVAALLDLASRDPRTRDLGRTALREALVGIVATLDVYRTYVDADGIGPGDRARIEAAVAGARRRAPATDPDAFDFVAAVLTLDLADARAGDRDDILGVAMRVQQFSGPVMAKGLEDSALYRYNRLIALNEVGSEPGHFGLDVAAFHRANAARLADEPRAMLTTSTHDTKRGEDARARIAALSGHVVAWRAKIAEWHDLLARPDAPIDRNEEYLFYQLLLGVWPFEWRRDTALGDADLAGLAGRVREAMLKSAREAGVNTRWVFGDPAYEQRLASFVDRALTPGGAFLDSFRDFEATVADDGAASALVQAALKLTVPGVPDIYQGAELWEQSLVDPDNRRPIDFPARRAMLRDRPGADRTTGKAKLALTRELLGLRRSKPALFAAGSYVPLAVEGPAAASICAFARRHGDDLLVVAAALHGVARRDVDETRIQPPQGTTGPWRSLLDGERLPDLSAAALFAASPVAVLTPA